MARKKKLHIRQIRSRIHCPEVQKRTLDALGLRRMNQVVVHDDGPSVRGMIWRVRHLVNVEEVQE
ncbi:50S ribosomal protein L30 [Candidatus Fermentibacteria bacterium]|nr:50S ribosomal protein L30 [Candidatus Fermentibacteria bacterium]